jgi:hypothetical protein
LPAEYDPTGMVCPEPLFKPRRTVLPS